MNQLDVLIQLKGDNSDILDFDIFDAPLIILSLREIRNTIDILSLIIFTRQENLRRQIIPMNDLTSTIYKLQRSERDSQ